MKAFLLVFDPSRVDRDMVVRHIDRMKDVENWYAMFGNTMCIASELESKDLSRSIHDRFPELRFIITEVYPSHKAGWLPKSIWSFLNDPQSAEAESA